MTILGSFDFFYKLFKIFPQKVDQLKNWTVSKNRNSLFYQIFRRKLLIKALTVISLLVGLVTLLNFFFTFAKNWIGQAFPIDNFDCEFFLGNNMNRLFHQARLTLAKCLAQLVWSHVASWCLSGRGKQIDFNFPFFVNIS